MDILRLGTHDRHLTAPAVVCHRLAPTRPLLAREEFTPLGQERHKLVSVDAWGDFVIDWLSEFAAWKPAP